jgi:hypothetical protein
LKNVFHHHPKPHNTFFSIIFSHIRAGTGGDNKEKNIVPNMRAGEGEIIEKNVL